MKQARWAVIIPHFNDFKRLSFVLNSLETQINADDELIVVDNGSDDAERHIAELKQVYPTVKFVCEPRKGAAFARNKGVAVSKAAFIAFIDADCVAEDHWLAVAKSSLLPDTIMGGQVRLFDETAGSRSSAQCFEHVFAFDFENYIQKKGFSGSGNMILSRKVFDRVGGFRNGLSEDKDFCQRARGLGIDVAYLPALIVYHPTRSNWPELKSKWQRISQEMYNLSEPGLRHRLGFALRSLAMLPSILPHSVKVMRSQALSGPIEKAKAIWALSRIRFFRFKYGLYLVCSR